MENLIFLERLSCKVENMQDEQASFYLAHKYMHTVCIHVPRKYRLLIVGPVLE